MVFSVRRMIRSVVVTLCAWAMWPLGAGATPGLAGARAGAGAAAVTPTAPSLASIRADYASPALDIIPSGQYGSVPAPAQAADQAKMYDGLTPLFGDVRSSDLLRYFKPETLGTPGQAGLRPEPVPRAGLSIMRDAYDVPHIYGASADDVTYGAGWVTAEDRGLLLEQARYDGLVAAVDAPGLSALNLVASLKTFKPSAQTEREVARQTGVLLAAGAKGRLVLHDIDTYLAGINAYFAFTHQPVAPFTRVDIYAFNALKDQFVGEGGGDEAVRSEFLAGLEHRLGARRGMQVFDDLREANDPEAPVSVPGRVRFQAAPRSLSGNVVLDNGSLTVSATAALATEQRYRQKASNILMVSGRRSATHHPIMVAGPQIGYFYPGFTLEMDLHGPGIDVRGAATAPLPGYILIGRGSDFSWSLTSAGLDQIDTYAETLCAHSTHRYLFDGRCLSMHLFDAGTLGGRRVAFYRTVHGPVVGYARTHGRLVALSRKRSSYGRDALDLLFYRDVTHGQVHNVHQFFRAASQTPQTFNSFYMDDRDIGVFTSGLVPIRPANADQDLPMDGRGREEWRGFVPFQDHPMGINPPNGEIVNWNNRTQAGYQAPDDNWSLGALQRVDLLLKNLGSEGGVTPAKVVSAMNEAATQDVREATFEPLLSRLLRTGRAPSARDARMLSLLDAWYRHGASRLDRTGTGRITDPGASIMDTAWPYLADAWASAVLGPRLTAQLAAFDSQFDLPPGGQYTGWHIYMDKDLRTLLRERVRGRYSVRYCGAGRLATCRRELWGAMTRAGARLAATQGADPAAWRSDAQRERIKFVPGLLPYTMRYTNRPSGIQQVLSFLGHAPQDTGR